MIKSNHVTTGVIVFLIFVTLFTGVYSSFEKEYDISRDGTGCLDCDNVNTTIGDDFLDMQVMQGIDKIVKALNDFTVPGNILLKSFEVITGAGLGILQTFLGLAILPGQIVTVILKHYVLPDVVAGYIGLIFNLYILFILLRHILKGE